MLEQVGDLWQKHSDGYWVVIPTNLQVDKYGHAIMGAGLAKEAAIRFPRLPAELGFRLFGSKQLVAPLANFRIICYPTKYKFYLESDIELISSAARELADMLKAVEEFASKFAPNPIYLPRVGCGLGKLNWKDVKPVLEQHLDNRFVVLSQE